VMHRADLGLLEDDLGRAKFSPVYFQRSLAPY